MHLLGVPGSNFVSIAMRSFGQHDQYPFEPSPKTGGCSGEDGHRHVAKMGDAGLGSCVLGQYLRSQGKPGERNGCR